MTPFGRERRFETLAAGLVDSVRGVSSEGSSSGAHVVVRRRLASSASSFFWTPAFAGATKEEVLHDQSGFAPDVFTTSAHFFVSLARKSLKCCGEGEVITSAVMFSRILRTSGMLSTLTQSPCTLRTILGV
jgi:hypothetical protein